MENTILNNDELTMSMDMENIPIPILEPEDTEMIPYIEKTPVDIPVEKPNCCTKCEGEMTIGKYFGTMMESVVIGWKFHLKTRSHAAHTTLNDFYEEALELVDNIVEHYQGRFGVVDGYENCICDCDKTDISYLTELRGFVMENRNSMIPETMTEIISDIDDFVGMIDSTIYKLTTLTESRRNKMFNRRGQFSTFEEFVLENYDVCGVEGGVGGSFDNITKSTKTNTAPAGAAKMGTIVSPKTKSSKCTSCCCDDTEGFEEEE